jgi:hypothetical protein
MRDDFSIYDMDFIDDIEECEFDGMIQIDGQIFYT